MSSKQKIGYLFLTLSVSLLLIGVGLLPKIYHALLRFIGIFFKPISDSEVGSAIGTLLGWTFYITLSLLLLDVGRKWIKRPVDPF